MKLRLLILLAAALAAAPAAGQTIKSLGYNTTNGQVVYSGTNPLTFTNPLAFGDTTNTASIRTNLGGTTVGDSVFTATNAAAAATAIGLGTTNYVGFGGVEILGDELQINGASINSVAFGGKLDFEERRFSDGVSTVFEYSTNSFAVTPNATFSTNVTVNGNATLNGVDNLAPSQTASSGSSLMTRDLSDDRYSFSQWYDANDLLSGAQNVGANPLTTGNTAGHIVNATLVTVSDVNTKFMLPVDYRVSGEVKVVSYWTDRTLTNGGTTGDIAVWTMPFVVQPTTDTTTRGDVSGTQIQNTFTANYGGSGNSRFYVMEQTLNFASVTGISATNPMQLKWVELQRRAADASDTSNDNIFLSGVHIYVP